MMTREEHIEKLLARYFAAETTPAEEHELRRWFLRTEQVPRRWRHAQTLFRGLEALSLERMPDKDAARTDYVGTTALSSQDSMPGTGVSRSIPLSRPASRRKPLWWGIAAAALVLGAVLGAELLRKPYCYIDGVAVYDRQTALQTTAYLDGLSRLDDPMRIVDELIEKSK